MDKKIIAQYIVSTPMWGILYKTEGDEWFLHSNPDGRGMCIKKVEEWDVKELLNPTKF